MSFSTSRIKKQIISLLDANERNISGVRIYSTTVGDEGFLSEEFDTAIAFACLEVMKAICESDSNPGRTDFISLVAVNHGAQIPFHYGPAGVPVITPFSPTKTVSDAELTINSTTVTSATAEFTAEDEGKAITLTKGIYSMETTIDAFIDEETIELADPWTELSDTDVTLEYAVNHLPYAKEGTRKSYEDVVSYRENPVIGAFGRLYGDGLHNEPNPENTTQASPLAGFYAIVNERFYFTGYSAQIPLALFSESDYDKIPASYEATVMKLAFGYLAKDGTLSDKFSQYHNLGLHDLVAIRSGELTVPSIKPVYGARDKGTK